MLFLQLTSSCTPSRFRPPPELHHAISAPHIPPLPLMSHPSHPSSAKTRHYAHLASRIHALQANLAETEVHMGKMAEQLGDMSRLGAWAGSQ